MAILTSTNDDLYVGGEKIAFASSLNTPNRNLIMNGGFDIWQRGLTFSVSGYTADRWKIVNTDATATVSKVIATYGNSHGIVHNLKMVTNASLVTYSEIQHRIEGIRNIKNIPYTLSFVIKTTGSTGVMPIYYQNFGSGGTASSAVGVGLGTKSTTTTFTRHSYTFTPPSIAGKTLDGGDDFFGIGFRSYIADETVEISNIQLENGSIATPFEQRPIGAELALCQRYYQLLTENVELQLNLRDLNSSSRVINTVFYPVSMAGIPTINYTHSAGLTIESVVISKQSAEFVSEYDSIVDTRIKNITADAEL